MSRKSALAATGFFRLWTAESVSMTGSQLTAFALPLVAVLTLHAAVWQMGLLSAAASLSVLVLGLSAGVWADHHERRSVMLLANVVRGVALFLVPLLYWLHELNIFVLLIVSFVVGVMSQLFDSAMSAYLPRLVGDDMVVRANSWVQAIESTGEVGGPGVAGILVQFLGAPVTILVDCVSYLVSIFSLYTLPKAAPEHGQDTEEESHWRSAVSGLRLLWSNEVMRAIAIASAHFNLFTSMFFALYTFYAIRILHFSPFLLGAITMTGGVAGLLGAAATTRLSTRFGADRILLAGYALPGIVGLLVPAAASFGKPEAAALLGISSFFWSFCVVILLIISMTFQQRVVPDKFMGRVSAGFRFISWGIEPLGALIGGFLGSSALGVRDTMTIATVGIAPSALWLLSKSMHAVAGGEPAPADSADQASAASAPTAEPH